MGQRNGDGARTRSHVEHTKRLLRIQLSQYCLDEVLRLGPRDQYGGRDVQRETVELLFTGDVLDGLVHEATLNKRVIRGLLCAIEYPIWICEIRGACDPCHIQQEKKRVAACIGAKPRRRLKLAGAAR